MFGRFLDSICDYAVNAAVFFGLAVNGGLTIGKAAVAVIALESATWQCSAFSYYYVHYRNLTGGDTTSQLNESESEGYPWDDPRLVHILRRLYAILFGWQDALLGKLDRALTPDPASPVYRNKRLLTAITVLGLGFQLLLIAVLAWWNRVSWVFALFIVGLNAYWAIFMVVRHRLTMVVPPCVLPDEQMSDQLPYHWSMSMAYHQARKDLYRSIITDCRLPSDALIVDAGCGDGFFGWADRRGRRAGGPHRGGGLQPRTARSCTLPRNVVELCLTDVERSRTAARDVRRGVDVQEHALSARSTTACGRTGRAAAVRWTTDRHRERAGRLADRGVAHGLRAASPRRARPVRAATVPLYGSSSDRYHAPRHLPDWLAAPGCSGSPCARIRSTTSCRSVTLSRPTGGRG